MCDYVASNAALYSNKKKKKKKKKKCSHLGAVFFIQLHDCHGGTLSFASICHWCNDVTGVTDMS